MRWVPVLACLTALACSERVQQEAFLLERPDGEYTSIDHLTFRTEAPGSPVLLFKAQSGEVVMRFDPSIPSVSHHGVENWTSATGGVAKERQTWVPTQDWDIDPPKLSFRGRRLETVGRHHMAYGRSLDRAYVAVLSADGWYRASKGGFIPFLGGRSAWAGGDHYHQVFDYRTAETIGEPALISLSSRGGSVSVSWTLDNQYVIYTSFGRAVAVAPTGLPPEDVRTSVDGVDVFQPTAWRNPWIWGIQLRYLDDEGDSFVLRHVRGSAAYVYEHGAHTFLATDPSTWEEAPGAPWDDYDLDARSRYKGVKTLDESDEARPVRLSEEQAGDAARVFELSRGTLRRFGKELATAGGTPERLKLSPRFATALVFSSDEAGVFYQERYALPSGKVVGKPLRLPRTIREAPHVLWTPDERYVIFWDPDAALLYVQRLNVAVSG